MFEETTVYPTEPSSFVLMLSGLIALAAYLLMTGRWQEVGLPTFTLPTMLPVKALRRSTPSYAVVDYELRFASMVGCALYRQTGS